MSESSSSRRTVAEINFGAGQSTGFNIGNRSIHQFWHLFSSYFRSVLLAPQRRPDSGAVAWNWREPDDNSPLAALELSEVRRRLSDGNRLLTGSGKGRVLVDDDTASGQLDAQVREKVSEMVAQLIAKSDQALAGFVCRTETGLMVHSWGAETPAQPHHPGTSEGVISGTVFIGEDRTEGLAVVLENRTGGFVARTKSGHAGAFSFQNIAPGSYRVRVTGRGEFPAGGLAVTMERESLTGLEVRGKATAESGAPLPGPTEKTPASTDQSAPRRKRRVIAWLALLAALVGGGIYYWQSTNRTADVAPNGNQASGWQSAHGQLAGPAERPSEDDVRPRGADGGWSTLTPASRQAKTPEFPSKTKIKPPVPVTASAKAAAAKSDSPADSSPPEASLAADPSAQPEKSDRAVSSEKKPPVATVAPDKNKTDRAPKDAAASAGKPPATKESADADEPDDSATARAEKSAAESAAKAKTKAAHATAKAGSSPASDPSSGASSSDEASPPTASPVASAAPAKNQPSHPAAAKKPPGSAGPSQATPAAEDAAPSDAPDSSAPNAAADSGANHSAPKTPGSSKPPAANATTHAAAASPAAAETAPADAAANSTDSSPSPDSPAKQNPAKPPAAAKRPPASATTNASPPPDAAPPEDSPAENAPPTPAAATKAPAKPAQAAASKAPKPAAEENAPTPAPAEDAPVASPEAASPAPSSPSAARSKPSQKNRAPAAKAPAAHADEPPALPAEAALSRSSRNPASAVIQEPLIQLAQVRASGWKTRQVQDLILPTQPVPAAEDEAIEALREKLRREQSARIPSTFRQPVITSGFALEFPADKSGSGGQPRWHAATGQTVGATVQGNRAEVAWSGTAPSGPIDYILSYPDGREIARVHTDGDGTPALEAAAEVRGWYWVGVAHSTADDAATSSSSKTQKLDWRLLSAATVPATWPQSDHWFGGRGHRVDLPLNASAVDRKFYSLALFDPLTGWALVSEIKLR